MRKCILHDDEVAVHNLDLLLVSTATCAIARPATISLCSKCANALGDAHVLARRDALVAYLRLMTAPPYTLKPTGD